ncbi:MAG: hypothetical protein Q9183_005662, partial [Haloplaca sp. 2 TL-2023]
IFGLQNTISPASIIFNPHEINTTRVRLATRAIKIKGLAQLQDLYPYLQAQLDRLIADELKPNLATDGGDWSAVQITPLMRHCATGMLGVYLFGNTLSDKADFAWAMDQYYKDTMTSMGILQLVPSKLRKYGPDAAGAIDSTNAEWEEDKTLQSVTLLQNMIEASEESNYWTPEVLSQALLGYWFAASHQPWIV